MRSLWRAGLAGLVMAVLWVTLALVDGVLHFAPLLVSAVVPLGSSLEKAPGRRLLVWATLLGAGLGLAATAVLAALGRLDEPALLPTGGALAEAIALSLAGAAIGLVVGLVRRRG